MIDPFKRFAPGLESPAVAAAEIAPSDTEDLATVPRALFATGAGVVRVTMLSGQDVTLPILAGPALPVRVTRVWATGTSATGLVGTW